MIKPNLFLPGFPKSGTSALHNALAKHIEIYDGEGIKDPKDYTYDNRYSKRFKTFRERYAENESKYIIDSSTTYMVCNNSIKRIVKDTPSAKFIIIARDPIDRIVSHYNWLSSLKLINRKPLDEIKFHLNENFDYRNHYRGNYKAYIDFSMYGKHMKRLLKNVDKNKILFLLYEDLFYDFSNEKKKIGKFLELDFDDINIDVVNKTSFQKKKKTPTLSGRVKGKLKYEYRIIWKGNPRGKTIKHPIQHKVNRNEIEELLSPILKEDLFLLKNMGYEIDSWPTYKNFKL